MMDHLHGAQVVDARIQANLIDDEHTCIPSILVEALHLFAHVGGSDHMRFVLDRQLRHAYMHGRWHERHDDVRPLHQVLAQSPHLGILRQHIEELRLTPRAKELSKVLELGTLDARNSHHVLWPPQQILDNWSRHKAGPEQEDRPLCLGRNAGTIPIGTSATKGDLSLVGRGEDHANDLVERLLCVSHDENRCPRCVSNAATHIDVRDLDPTALGLHEVAHLVDEHTVEQMASEIQRYTSRRGLHAMWARSPTTPIFGHRSLLRIRPLVGTPQLLDVFILPRQLASLCDDRAPHRSRPTSRIALTASFRSPRCHHRREELKETISEVLRRLAWELGREVIHSMEQDARVIEA
mmetsp:Transcript_155970/g.500065  ORF Transcript_155970/g.500065 Transcript_155970/m.500065 type:complete len:352 (-) Transcript_155970:1208-2263(-)